MGGRQNGVPRTRRGEQTTGNIEAGKSSPKHPPLTTQPTAPLFSSHPAKRAPDARKLGVGTPRSGSEHTAAPRLPAPKPRPPSFSPPTQISGPPRPGARSAAVPGLRPRPRPSAAPAFRHLPGQPIPAATDSGSRRAARPASSSSGGGGGSNSGGSPDRPMLRLSAIRGDAEPCRARPASDYGGGRKEERGGLREGRGPGRGAVLGPVPPRPAPAASCGGRRQQRGVPGAAPGPPRFLHSRRRRR